MGKRIITQRRGRGTTTYRSHSFKHLAAVKHRKYDEAEKTGIVKGKIVDFVKCKGHSSPLAQVKYEDGTKIYMLAPTNTKVHDEIASGAKATVKPGNTLPLGKIPEGTFVYNIENRPADGGKFVRASGGFARVVAVVNEKIKVKFPSKKEKLFNPLCRATVGVIAAGGRVDKPFVKAGTRHHLMRARSKLYPRTSGVAMNAVDHPFGSGRGRHIGKPKTAPRWAPPGRNVGYIKAKKTGRGRKKR